MEKIDRIVRIKEVSVIVGFSRSSIYRLMDEGKFPAAVKIGERAVGWRLSSIEKWLKTRESQGVRTYPSNFEHNDLQSCVQA